MSFTSDYVFLRFPTSKDKWVINGPFWTQNRPLRTLKWVQLGPKIFFSQPAQKIGPGDLVSSTLKSILYTLSANPSMYLWTSCTLFHHRRPNFHNGQGRVFFSRKTSSFLLKVHYISQWTLTRMPTMIFKFFKLSPPATVGKMSQVWPDLFFDGFPKESILPKYLLHTSHETFWSLLSTCNL